MNTITVIKHQSLFDIAIQTYGTIEGIFSLCLENDIAITDELEPGRVLNVPKFDGANNEIVEYYKARNIKPATGITQQEAETTIPEEGCNYCKLFE